MIEGHILQEFCSPVNFVRVVRKDADPIPGLNQIDFVNYYHDQERAIRKMHVFTVDRDQDYIDRLEEKAMEFMIKCYRTARLKAPKISKPLQEKGDDDA